MCMLRLCNACTIGLKVHSLNPNVQRCNRTLVGNTSETDAIESQRFDFRRMVRLARWAMRSERIEGHGVGSLRRASRFIGDGTRDGLRPARAKVTERQ